MNSNEYRAILREREKVRPLYFVEIQSDGSFCIKDQQFLSSIAKNNSHHNILYDLSKLQQIEALHTFLSTTVTNWPIYNLQIDGKKLPSESPMIEELTQSLFFKNDNNNTASSQHENLTQSLKSIERLHFLHVPFQLHNFKQLYSRLVYCINPSSSLTPHFFGKWKILRFYDCYFPSITMLSHFLDAMKGNVYLEELEITLSHPPLSDELLQVMKNSLTRFETNLRCLSLCHHQFTAVGCGYINEILLHSRNKIQYLNLSNNPNLLNSIELSPSANRGSGITDVGEVTSSLSPSFPAPSLMNNMMLAVLSTQQLEELHLSNCGLQDCGWTQYISFLPSLQVLNVSSNGIDDNNCVKLLMSIVQSCSLRELNLANNRFHQARCGQAFTTVLQQNHSLQAIDISFNRLEFLLWKAITVGLQTNPTILSVKCNSCLIGWKEIEVFIDLMTENDMCELSLSHNPLPASFIRNPRQFLIQMQSSPSASSSPDMKGVPKSIVSEKRTILAAAVGRERRSIETARSWRKQQKEKIQLSLQSIYIMKQQRQLQQQKLHEQQQQIHLKRTASEHEHLKAISTIDSEVAGTSTKHILIVPSPPREVEAELFDESIDRSNTIGSMRSLRSYEIPPPAVPSVDENLQRVCWTKEIVEQSEYFFSTTDLQNEIGDLDHYESNESREVMICLGLSSYSIGTIDIKKRFSYHLVREKMIEPMIIEYCRSVDPKQMNEFVNFTMVNMKEEVIRKEEMKTRKVWSDVYNEEHPYLLIKPATWMKL